MVGIRPAGEIGGAVGSLARLLVQRLGGVVGVHQRRVADLPVDERSVIVQVRVRRCTARPRAAGARSGNRSPGGAGSAFSRPGRTHSHKFCRDANR